jgi:hypothetical protein
VRQGVVIFAEPAWLLEIQVDYSQRSSIRLRAQGQSSKGSHAFSACERALVFRLRRQVLDKQDIPIKDLLRHSKRSRLFQDGVVIFVQFTCDGGRRQKSPGDRVDREDDTQIGGEEFPGRSSKVLQRRGEISRLSGAGGQHFHQLIHGR